jgi:uncharacterized pyridoxamine 5'-phosphate oxidase family protein
MHPRTRIPSAIAAIAAIAAMMCSAVAGDGDGGHEMVEQEPLVDLGPFSSDDAIPAGWAQARGELQDAQVYWLSTVRPDGRPHVTTLLGVWLDDSLYFCTGSTERKAKNLAQNPHCALTTGRNDLDDGVDLVVEGAAVKVSDDAELRSVADAYESKYGPQITAPEGTWFGLGDTIQAVTLWCTGSLPRRPSPSARASGSVRRGGVSLSGSGTNLESALTARPFAASSERAIDELAGWPFGVPGQRVEAATVLRCYATKAPSAGSRWLGSAAAFHQEQGDVVVELPGDVALQLGPQRLQPSFQVIADQRERGRCLQREEPAAGSTLACLAHPIGVQQDPVAERQC